MRDGIEVEMLLMCCGKAVYKKKITVLHSAVLRLLPKVWVYGVAMGMPSAAGKPLQSSFVCLPSSNAHLKQVAVIGAAI